jgi:bifunctional N-acetylglucosamine-1-phosphate-uridyltransferase/glucosamine-1-phosphate-acetyltransferase GlmU-like protein
VTNGKGLVARLLLSGGTGSIDVYDAVGATTNHLFTTTGTALAAVGGAVELMCPCPIGIYVVTGAGTTVTVVYS